MSGRRRLDRCPGSTPADATNRPATVTVRPLGLGRKLSAGVVGPSTLAIVGSPGVADSGHQVAFIGGYWLRPIAKPSASDIAVYPFEVVGLRDTALGTHLARLTASYLEALPGVAVAPVRTSFRDWRASALPPGERLTQLTKGPPASRYGVWAVIRPAQGQVEVQLQAVNARGEPVLQVAVLGIRPIGPVSAIPWHCRSCGRSFRDPNASTEVPPRSPV